MVSECLYSILGWKLEKFWSMTEIWCGKWTGSGQFWKLFDSRQFKTFQIDNIVYVCVCVSTCQICGHTVTLTDFEDEQFPRGPRYQRLSYYAKFMYTIASTVNFNSWQVLFMHISDHWNCIHHLFPIWWSGWGGGRLYIFLQYNFTGTIFHMKLLRNR